MISTIVAFIGAALFGVVVIMTILVALGLPFGEFTMGGKHVVMPPEMRILCWISVVIQIFAIIIILQTGDVIPLWFKKKATKYICIFFAVYLSLNSVMNFSSNSRKEKLFVTPFSVLTSICFWVTSLTCEID